MGKHQILNEKIQFHNRAGVNKLDFSLAAKKNLFILFVTSVNDLKRKWNFSTAIRESHVYCHHTMRSWKCMRKNSRKAS